LNYDAWDIDYEENRDEYLKIFDKVMSQNNHESIQFPQLANRKYSVPVSSATDALHFSLLACNIQPGDEVLVTDFSWISSASCISMVGALPVFCDIDLESYHISFESIQRMVTPKTKALVYTHLFGNMTDTTKILEFCKDRNIAFIEDAAQSLGSSLNGIEAGSIGDCSSISFNSNKVVAGISGGGVFLTDDESMATHVEKLSRHGRGEMLGRNSKMYLLNCEIIKSRLSRMKVYEKERQDIARIYNDAFQDLPVHTQHMGNGLNHNYHKFVIRFEDNDIREMVREALNAKVHYDTPISKNPMYQYNRIMHKKDNCINSAIASNTILSLPVHPWTETQRIIDTIRTLS
jgi:perosamine synthetase